MSGIEITGLILAAFPLIISALEHHREGFEPLQEWWKFDSEFSNFIEELGTQRARFDLNLEKLLTPFVTSDTEMNALLNEPGSDSWKNPVLVDQVRKRLGTSYEWYATICRKIIVTLKNLEGRLGVQGGNVKYIEASKWDHELHRLRISFSRKKFKHVALLSKYNDELQQLLCSNDELAPARRRRKTPLLEVIRSLQEVSQDLYNALLDKWQCHCQLPHETNLLLEGRTTQSKKDNMRLHLLLRVQSGHKAVEIRIKDDNSAPAATAEVSNPFPGSLLELKQQVKDRPRQRRSPSPQNLRSSISELLKGMGMSRQKQPPDSSNNHSTDPRTHPKHNQKLRFDIPEAPPNPSTPTIHAEIYDICSQLHQSHLVTDCVGSITVSGESKFYLYMKQFKQPTSPLCNPSSLSDNCDTMTLAALLDGASMTRRQRFTLASTLAFALLQLQPTSWVTTTWSKNDIIFIRPTFSPSPVFTHAYVQKKFPAQPATRTQSSAGCKEALFRLGVLLLELTFNRSLESLPFRSKYLGPQGVPNEYTDLCTAKEWQREVEGECGEALSEAVRRCIDCSFGPKPDWQSEEFLEAYFGNVVEPLKEVLSQWESTV